jgi:ABC-type bacteriocin/lantibiotic exporter with double-glycine peptidase domain
VSFGADNSVPGDRTGRPTGDAPGASPGAAHWPSRGGPWGIGSLARDRGLLSLARSRHSWLWSHIRPRLPALCGVLALTLLNSALSTALPYLSKLIIDRGLIGHNVRALLILCASVVGLAALSLIVGGIARWIYIRASAGILFGLREQVYGGLLTLAPEFYRRRPVGDLVTRLDGDVAEIQRFSTDTLLACINGLLLLVGTAAVMLAMSWQLTLVAAAVLPIQLAVRRWARPLIRDRTRALREQTSEVSQFLFETLSSVKAIQGAAAEDHIQGRLRGLNSDYLARLLSLQIVSYGLGGLSGLLSHATTAAVFIYGGFRVVDGSLTVGTLVAFVAYMARGTGSAVSLLNLYTAYQRALVSLERVEELLVGQPREKADPGQAQPREWADPGQRLPLEEADPGLRQSRGRADLGSGQPGVREDPSQPPLGSADECAQRPQLCGDHASQGTPVCTDASARPLLGTVSGKALTLRNVSLGRRACGAPLLTDCSFEFPAGCKVVIYGASGVGKSTLIDAMRRFVPLDSGAILLGGEDVADYDTAVLRRAIEVLVAEPVIFRGTLLENIRFGSFDATDFSVADAARRAGLDEVSGALPSGLNTLLGTGGLGLSAGQRQRVAIARTLLRSPAILVLDEALANLDPESAAALHGVIDTQFADCTRIVVSHAPSLVPRADLIVEMREGRLIQTPRAVRA